MALDGIDLAIGENEFVSLVGTSGCGKSTLLSIVAGLDAEDEGSGHVDGAPVEGPGATAASSSRATRCFPG